jgi:hypothetical protein
MAKSPNPKTGKPAQKKPTSTDVHQPPGRSEVEADPGMQDDEQDSADEVETRDLPKPVPTRNQWRVESVVPPWVGSQWGEMSASWQAAQRQTPTATMAAPVQAHAGAMADGLR